jgi:hypothetical protein
VPLSVNFENEIVLTSGVASEIVRTTADRHSVVVQVQARGDVWIRLAGVAQVGRSFLFEGMKIINLDDVLGSSAVGGAYQGPVSVLWDDGGAEGRRTPTAPCWIVELVESA